MSDYTLQVSWSGKDALSSSDPNKVVSGDDFNTEFAAVQTAVNSKYDSTDLNVTIQGDVISTRGDVIRGASSGNAERLALGADGTAVMSDGTDAVFAGIHKQGKHTIFIPAAAMRPTKSNGCAPIADIETTAGRPDMQVLDFDDDPDGDGAGDEHAQFQIAMPKSWNRDVVTAQFYWTSTATDTDGVTWGIQGVAVSDNESIGVVYGGAVVIDDNNQGAAAELLVSDETPELTIGGSPAVGDMCFFRVFRDVSDTNDTATEDARLLGVKMFITTNAADDT
jgi:hypothetical protein